MLQMRLFSPRKSTDIFFYFSVKTYFVGTHKKCLDSVLLMNTHNICFGEALLMSTHNMFSWRNKKRII